VALGRKQTNMELYHYQHYKLDNKARPRHSAWLTFLHEIVTWSCI